MKTKILLFVAFLVIAACPTHSQTSIPNQFERTIDILRNQYPMGQLYRQYGNQSFSMSVNSIKERLLAHQKQILSKNTVLSAGEIVVDIYQTWKNNGWVNSGKDSTTADSLGHTINLVVETGNGSPWRNSYQHSYTYDKYEHETSDLYQTWS